MTFFLLFGSATLIASGCACCAWRVLYHRPHTTTTVTRYRHPHYRPHPRTMIPVIIKNRRGKPCKIENTTPPARTLVDMRAVARWNCTLFFFISLGGSRNPVLIRRYPWNHRTYTYITSTEMDDRASTLITVISPAYFTYHSHLGNSSLGGTNHTVRYHEQARSLGSDGPVARAAIKLK